MADGSYANSVWTMTLSDKIALTVKEGSFAMAATAASAALLAALF